MKGRKDTDIAIPTQAIGFFSPLILPSTRRNLAQNTIIRMLSAASGVESFS